MIPHHLHPLFWDVELWSFEPECFPEYTIGRILEYGDQAAVAWMRSVFAAPAIVAGLRGDLRLSRKSATFWSLVYALPQSEVAALKEPPRRSPPGTMEELRN